MWLLLLSLKHAHHVVRLASLHGKIVTKNIISDLHIVNNYDFL